MIALDLHDWTASVALFPSSGKLEIFVKSVPKGRSGVLHDLPLSPGDEILHFARGQLAAKDCGDYVRLPAPIPLGLIGQQLKRLNEGDLGALMDPLFLLGPIGYFHSSNIVTTFSWTEQFALVVAEKLSGLGFQDSDISPDPFSSMVRRHLKEYFQLG